MQPDVLNGRYRVKLVAAHFTLNKRIHSSKMSTSTCTIFKNETLFQKIFWSIQIGNIYQNMTWNLKKYHFTSPCYNFIKLSNFWRPWHWVLKAFTVAIAKTAAFVIACLDQDKMYQHDHWPVQCISGDRYSIYKLLHTKLETVNRAETKEWIMLKMQQK